MLAFLTIEVYAQWKPVGDKIKTQWVDKVNPSAVLPEYPRPIMERSEWQNLNGLWNYAITDLGEKAPRHFDGQILVPFAVESSLSGVGQRVGAKRSCGILVHLKYRLLGKIKIYCFISVRWIGKQMFG